MARRRCKCEGCGERRQIAEGQTHCRDCRDNPKAPARVSGEKLTLSAAARYEFHRSRLMRGEIMASDPALVASRAVLEASVRSWGPVYSEGVGYIWDRHEGSLVRRTTQRPTKLSRAAVAFDVETFCLPEQLGAFDDPAEVEAA